MQEADDAFTLYKLCYPDAQTTRQEFDNLWYMVEYWTTRLQMLRDNPSKVVLTIQKRNTL